MKKIIALQISLDQARYLDNLKRETGNTLSVLIRTMIERHRHESGQQFGDAPISRGQSRALPVRKKAPERRTRPTKRIEELSWASRSSPDGMASDEQRAPRTRRPGEVYYSAVQTRKKSGKRRNNPTQR